MSHRIDAILAWAESNPKFDTSFVEDLKAKVARGRELSERQSAALDNIINRWKINLDEASADDVEEASYDLPEAVPNVESLLFRMKERRRLSSAFDNLEEPF